MIKKLETLVAAAALLLIAIIFISPSLKAQDTLSFGTAVNSFTASSSGATTAGTAYALPGNPAAIVTWTTSYSATPDAVTILLQGSLDNSTYSTLDTSTAVAGEIRSVTTSARFVRASITAKTGTFNTTVALVAKAAGVPDMSVAIGTLGATHGGTGSSTYTKGDLLCASSSTTLAKLAVGANDTIVTADSAQSCGVKWAAPSGVSILHQATVTLTDAQIIALPITPVSLVTAPGSNKILIPSGVSFFTNIDSDNYTNINSDAALAIRFSTSQSEVVFVENNLIEGRSQLTKLLSDSPHFLYTLFGTFIVPNSLVLLSDESSNNGLEIVIYNNGDGPLGGGILANRLKVSVNYFILNLTTGLYE